jgi:hypothetical protein
MKFNQNYKLKTVYYLVTETEIYRTDKILEQINEWIHAFKSGKILRVPSITENELDEFEAHLEETLLESQKLVQQDDEF